MIRLYSISLIVLFCNLANAQDSIRPVLGIHYQIATYNKFQSSFNEFGLTGGVEYRYFCLMVGYGLHVSNAYIDGYSSDHQRKFDFLIFDLNVRFRNQKDFSANLGLSANYTLRTFNKEFVILEMDMEPYIGVFHPWQRYYQKVKQHYAINLGLSYRFDKFEFNLWAPLSFYFVDAYELYTSTSKVSTDFVAPSIGFKFGVKHFL